MRRASGKLAFPAVLIYPAVRTTFLQLCSRDGLLQEPVHTVHGQQCNDFVFGLMAHFFRTESLDEYFSVGP
jgi:hypothetical protein